MLLRLYVKSKTCLSVKDRKDSPADPEAFPHIVLWPTLNVVSIHSLLHLTQSSQLLVDTLNVQQQISRKYSRPFGVSTQ